MHQYVRALFLLAVLAAYSSPKLRAAEAKRSRLEAKIEPIEYNYCPDDHGGGALQIPSEIRFINVGTQRLILYRASGEVLEMRAAKTKADLEAGRLEGRMIFTIVTGHLGPPPLKSLLEPSVWDFVILSPGASYGTRETLAIVYRKPGAQFRALDVGKHYVQFFIETWPESSDLGRALQKKWKKWGDLWFEPTVLSEPLLINIPANPKAGHCD